MKFAAEYPTPLPFFAKKDESFVLRLNEYEADMLLTNLKLRFEF